MSQQRWDSKATGSSLAGGSLGFQWGVKFQLGPARLDCRCPCTPVRPRRVLCRDTARADLGLSLGGGPWEVSAYSTQMPGVWVRMWPGLSPEEQESGKGLRGDLPLKPRRRGGGAAVGGDWGEPMWGTREGYS